MTETGPVSLASLHRLRWIARAAVALVWGYQGIYCKLMLGDISHLEVLCNVPFINPAYALLPLAALGLFEAGLAAWVLSGVAPRLAAWVQTGLLLAMNAGGLLWAPGSINHAGAMVVQNISFLVLVWFAATVLEGHPHGRAHA